MEKQELGVLGAKHADPVSLRGLPMPIARAFGPYAEKRGLAPAEDPQLHKYAIMAQLVVKGTFSRVMHHLVPH